MYEEYKVNRTYNKWMRRIPCIYDGNGNTFTLMKLANL